MKVFLPILLVMSVPIAVLNWLGGLVSGVWLLCLGEWKALGLGVLSLLFGAVLLSLAFAPGLLFAAFAMKLNKNRVLLSCIVSLSSLYMASVISAWCLTVLWLCLRMSNEATTLPFIIWSYGVATSPLAWMAHKDQQGGENPRSVYAVFFASVAHITCCLLVLCGNPELPVLCVVFGGVMLCDVVVNVLSGFAELSREREGFVSGDYSEPASLRH